MQKKIIVLAVAGTIGSIVAGSVFAADTPPTIYGRIDYGYQSTSGDSGGLKNQKSTNAFASGIEAGSRIGIKGANELNNGLKAIYEVEFGITVDQSSTAGGGAADAKNSALGNRS